LLPYGHAKMTTPPSLISLDFAFFHLDHHWHSSRAARCHDVYL